MGTTATKVRPREERGPCKANISLFLCDAAWRRSELLLLDLAMLTWHRLVAAVP